MSGRFGAALEGAGAWLLEPARPAREPELDAPPSLRPVVAVFGLAPGCGATVVARALAAELARRDRDGAAVVHCESRLAGVPLATAAAQRLSRQLADVRGAETRAVGRLCLVGGTDYGVLADTARHLAPLVLDAGASALGGVAAAVSDRVVVVGGPATEPALAAVAVDCLGRVGQDPVMVRNRTIAESDMTHVLPDSRMGAQLALGGREPRGQMGRAVAQLVDLCGFAQ
jgi:hypothetical protein